MNKEIIKSQIRELMKALARNNFEARKEKNINRQLELAFARVEIYKSIAHRQSLLLDVICNEMRFMSDEAA